MTVVEARLSMSGDELGYFRRLLASRQETLGERLSTADPDQIDPLVEELRDLASIAQQVEVDGSCEVPDGLVLLAAKERFYLLNALAHEVDGWLRFRAGDSDYRLDEISDADQDARVS